MSGATFVVKARHDLPQPSTQFSEQIRKTTWEAVLAADTKWQRRQYGPSSWPVNSNEERAGGFIKNLAGDASRHCTADVAAGEQRPPTSTVSLFQQTRRPMTRYQSVSWLTFNTTYLVGVNVKLSWLFPWGEQNNKEPANSEKYK